MRTSILCLVVLGVSLATAQLCCQSLTAECRACAAGQSVEDFCMDCVERGSNDIGCNDCFARQLTTRCTIRSLLSSGLMGAFTPKCEADGSFSPMQCSGSTGYCWCVDSNGAELTGTRRAPGQGRPTCGSSPCQQAVLAATRSRMMGAFVPQCEADGSYSSMQCHGSTGYCWCVDSNGVEQAGTRRGPGQGQPQCGAQTPCQQAVLSATKSRRIGAFVPQCEADGSYSAMQCHGSTGMCWCVNSDGSEILGTRSTPGSALPQCGAPQLSFLLSASTPCQQASLSAARSGLMGAFIPQCEADGSYSAMQCHGSTGYCWCVDDNGVEVTGTRRAPGQGQPQCTGSTPCQQASLSASRSKMMGVFVPKCEADGSYSAMQCHGSTGYCWCVDSNGVEKVGTRVAPGQGQPQCSSRVSCFEAASKRTIGGFAPRCEADGSYSAMQCHGSTGYCWCVDPNGTEINGTRRAPGTGLPSC